MQRGKLRADNRIVCPQTEEDPTTSADPCRHLTTAVGWSPTTCEDSVTEHRSSHDRHRVLARLVHQACSVRAAPVDERPSVLVELWAGTHRLLAHQLDPIKATMPQQQVEAMLSQHWQAWATPKPRAGHQSRAQSQPPRRPLPKAARALDLDCLRSSRPRLSLYNSFDSSTSLILLCLGPSTHTSNTHRPNTFARHHDPPYDLLHSSTLSLLLPFYLSTFSHTKRIGVRQRREVAIYGATALHTHTPT